MSAVGSTWRYDKRPLARRTRDISFASLPVSESSFSFRPIYSVWVSMSTVLSKYHQRRASPLSYIPYPNAVMEGDQLLAMCEAKEKHKAGGARDTKHRKKLLLDAPVVTLCPSPNIRATCEEGLL